MRAQILFPTGVAVALTIFAGFYFVRKQDISAMPAEIAVSNAWARATPPGASVGAVYLTLQNRGGEPDRLTGVSSPAARSAMLHQTVEENGVSSMREGNGSIAPGEALVMKPGGSHIMLMGLTERLLEGQTIDVTLDFEKAGRVNVATKVAPLGSDTAGQ
jgi:copper(I)-binding protein